MYQLTRKLILLLLGLAPLSFVFSASAADSPLPPYKHDHINIYPVSAISKLKGGIRIDGDLSDWKPEAFIEMCADPDLKEFFSCRIAFAYDATGLLCAAHFTDRSPLVNHIDPRVDPFKGWSGDALQMRFITDPSLTPPISADGLNGEQIVHLTLWYYTEESLPVIDVRYGMDFHSPKVLTGQQAGTVYRKDGDGYSLEGRIPWSVLHVAGPPQPGQKWIATLQPLWGDAGGRLLHNFFDCISSAGFQYQRPDGWGYGYFVKPGEVKTKLAEQAAEDKRIFAVGLHVSDKTKPGVPVKYRNPAKGYVSLAVCKPDGQIVRTLLAKSERNAGPQMEMWDGLDDDGNPVPPGEYVLKALTHPGIKPKFVMSVHNSGNPPWVTSDGRGGWGGDHGNPIGAASDPEGNTYLLWTFNEGGNFLICVDATGQKQWGANISWGDFNGGATALAYDNGLVYVAKDGGGGKPNRGGLFVYEAKTGRRTNFPNGQGTLLVTEWPPSLAEGVAESGSPSERMKNGKYTAADLGANLVGLAVGPDRIYCSLYLENKIVALDKKTFKVAETYAVQRPAGLACDAAKKLLFAVSGNSIVALDLAQGGKVKTLVSSGLEFPFGLALRGSENLWVSVRGRQMQALGFDTAGKLLKTIGKFGGRPWVGRYDSDGMLMPSGISVDAKGQLWVAECDNTPKRISLWDATTGRLVKEFFGSAAYAPMMAPDPEKPEEVYVHNTRFIVDYDKATAQPEATVYRAGYDGPSIPGSEMVYGFMGGTFEVSTYEGKRFAYNGHGGVFVFGRERFKPLLYIGGWFPGLPPLVPPDYPWNAGFVWTDANHDGLLSEGELRKVQGINFDNNIGQFGGTFFPGASFIKGRKLYRPTGLTSEGVPIYPRPEEAIGFACDAIKPYQNWLDVWPSLQSNWKDFYLIASERGSVQEGEGRAGVFRFTQNGGLRWRYSRVAVAFALKASLAKTGDLYGALRILGEAQLPRENGGEILGIGCYRGYYGFLNEDGLFIDQVGYDNGRGPSPGFDTFFIENFSGYFFRHPRTGKLYLFGGDVDGRILELQGWEKIKRFDAGKLTLTQEQYNATLASLIGGAAGGRGITAISVIASTPAMDGSLKGWDASKLAAIGLDETHKAQVGLACDSRNLYALFKIPDSSPWKNASKDWRFVFKGGDAVDIQIGIINPATDGSKRKTQPGDVRVMIAPSEDGSGCKVVAMWGKVPQGMTPEPQLYKSPTGEERFDRVALLSKVVCKVERQSQAYTVEVAVPWSELGLTTPASHSQMQGDLGVLLSDGTGTRTILRRYLFNKETAIVNDIPNEVRVNCANWGTLNFE